MPFSPDDVPGLIFAAVIYAAFCAASPYGHCRKCQGWGAKVYVSRFSGRLKLGRVCGRCDGRGVRLRLGRRVYNAVSRLRRDGTR